MPNIKESKMFESFCGEMKKLMQNENVSVLCAFSGGADSSALLHMLSAWFSDIYGGNTVFINSSDNIKTVILKATDTSFYKKDVSARLYNHNQKSNLFAVHVNHNIRGEEALRDERFCEKTCKELNVPLFVVSVDIPALSNELSLGIEETARNFRYDIFNRICGQYGINKVATAHNADDNLETVIFNIVRGSGTKGLCGIESTRDNIIRPLLSFTKSEILSFCGDNNIDYVLDSTNEDTNYTRNFIRKEIVPKLKSLNPEAANAAARLAFLAKQDNIFIEKELEKLQSNLSVKELQTLPYALLSRYLQREYTLYAKTLTEKNQSLSFTNISDFVEFINMGRDGSSLSLPCLIKATILDGKLVFEKDKEPVEDFTYCFPLMEGENRLPTGDKIFVLFNEEGKNFLCNNINVYKLFIYAVLNFDKIKDTVFVRSRRNGDKYRIRGMTKSIKKLFSEKKMPITTRSTHPVICDSEGIIWIPDFPVRDGLSADEKAINKLYLFYVKEN